MVHFALLLLATAAIIITAQSIVPSRNGFESSDCLVNKCGADFLDRVNRRHKREVVSLIAEYEGKLALANTLLAEQIDKFASLRLACGARSGLHALPTTVDGHAAGFTSPQETHVTVSGRTHGSEVAWSRSPQQRTLLQVQENGCSKDVVLAVINTQLSERPAFVQRVLQTNPTCGSCMASASGSLPPDSLYRVFACLHQNENLCATMDLAAITPRFPSATLEDRPSLLKMLELVTADCTYCLLETLEFVCGPGCVKERLHFYTDYPLLHRATPCVPALATHLAAAQAKAARAALQASAPFSLFAAPVIGATDAYFPEGGHFGGWAVYRGSQRRHQWLYRCLQEPETWVITLNVDREAWRLCEGRLWIELEAVRVRLNHSGDATSVYGLHFDLSPIRECSGMTDKSAETDSAQAQAAAELLAPEPNNVACTLLMQFGAHTVGTGGRSVTVRVPSVLDGIKLLGDVVVRAGDTLVLEAELQSALLIVGRRQLRVERGGKLDLVRINLVDSVESSAVYSDGALHLLNCTFERCVVSTNFVTRVAEGLVPSNTPLGLAPAILGSWGGAILAFWTSASVIASGTSFVTNAARGGHIVNAGGAIGAFGASVTLEAGTTFRNNYVEGGTFIARGGAISLAYARLEVSNAVFSHNWAHPNQTPPMRAVSEQETDGSLRYGTRGMPLFRMML